MMRVLGPSPTPLHHYTTTPLHHYTTTPLHHYTTTPLHHYTTTPLHHYTTTHLLSRSSSLTFLLPHTAANTPSLHIFRSRFFSDSVFFHGAPMAKNDGVVGPCLT
ncbi:hypothetical protein [Cyprinid herpesvirus 3]|uniref:Uncharacterized protein n=1 Tax=Cyprinid herpesvirus 3 TaxID=180230 RepID=A4FTB5_CYHV3|nr:hypothetical protein [Cyprinid herpesvirus 3]